MEALSVLQTWLYDNLPVAVAIFDRDLVYRYANASYAATQGQPAVKLSGRPLDENKNSWTELLHEMSAKAGETGRPADEYNVTLTYPRQPSILRTWDVTVMAVVENEAVDGFVVYMLDVTDRQEARRSGASEKRLRSILDTAIDAILVIDESGNILQANPATSRIFGYTNEELAGQPVQLIMPTPYTEEHPRFLERYLETNLPHIIGTIREVQGRRKNGEIFPMELSVAESQEFAPQRHFVGIIRDITDRKRLEAELESARARLAAIFNTVPLPLYVVEPDGRISIYNEAAQEFYGEIITGGRFFELTRLRPDTRATIPMEEWPIMRALREGKVFTDIEQIVVFPDGREVTVLVHAAPVVVEGTTVAAVVVSQDLTQLKAADRAKDAFLALITHELRSPLAAIISWADLALDDPSLCGEAMQVIQRSAQAQRRIIDDLLDISRVIYGKLALEKQPVDAWEIARRTAEEQRWSLEEKELVLELSKPSEPLPILADPVRLEQVMNNLLVNAVKFTPAGGRITVAGAREERMARLSVCDTGVGISPEQLPLLFERFQQIGRERVSGGLGLGLALVKGLVELHGGKAAAESPGIGKGSTFTVWLPLREE
jgi:PAS domain S-box-containing protein